MHEDARLMDTSASCLPFWFTESCRFDTINVISNVFYVLFMGESQGYGSYDILVIEPLIF